MRLQGRVYGAHMADAELLDGVAPFLRKCRDAAIPVFIISHKTEYGHFDPDCVNLRDAARSWMREKGFFDRDGFDVPEENLFFESTRVEKVRRIASTGCTHFIDDLEEVFAEPEFPVGTRRYLFVPGRPRPQSEDSGWFSSWQDIADAIFS